MGSALVKGWLRVPEAGVDLLVWDVAEASLERLPVSGMMSRAASLDELADRSDVLLVVVKPKNGAEVLGAIAGRLGPHQSVISAMAGVSMEWIRGVMGPGPALFRIMPNLGVEIGVGAVALAPEAGMDEARTRTVTTLLKPLGMVEVISEDLLDVVTAVSGSGPAFLALAMESIEDGAVAAGLSRSAARTLVRQAAAATAGLPQYADSSAGIRNGLLADCDAERVGIDVLEKRDVRSAFRQAVEAAMHRSREIREASG